MGYTAFVERSRDFILQARRDLEHARFALEKGFYEWAAFSAQQSAPRGCGLGALGAGSFGGAGQAASHKRVPPRRSQRAG
ncbi:HEPN domain-containing protein [Thermus sp. PS18]|uniref:HEPN domain-containing protein n=1 Tax=unclassified Thermus TaxID=2619321 RepID=UPI0020A200FD|nr:MULTISPECIES: HEPN domain-containing protein [unclassified Thermus]UZX15823.1 HEPN domain-containing protein [Thermus sp. PS18]